MANILQIEDKLDNINNSLSEIADVFGSKNSAMNALLNSEIQNRKNADSDEASLRADADNVLQSNIEAEASARTSANNELSSQVTNANNEITSLKTKISNASDWVFNVGNLNQNDENLKAIVSVAESYKTAQDSGIAFVFVNEHGPLYPNASKTTVDNSSDDGDAFGEDSDVTQEATSSLADLHDSTGANIIDSSMYIGLVLRGFDYDSSPYSTSVEMTIDPQTVTFNANATFSEAEFDLQGMNLDSDDGYHTSAGEKRIVVAADIAKYYANQNRIISVNDTRYTTQKGDLLFFSEKDTLGNPIYPTRFLGISHVGIMCDKSHYYIVTDDGDEVIQRVLVGADDLQMVCYARPAYGVITPTSGGTADTDSITAEAEARKSADETLQSNIDTEIANRQALADTVSQNTANIETIQEAINNATTTDIDSLADALGYEQIKNFYPACYIDLSETITDYTKESTLSTTKCTVVGCQEGDSFILTGKGGEGGRLYGFVDEDGRILDMAPQNADVTNNVILTPHGAAKLVVNFIDDSGVLYKNGGSNSISPSYYGADYINQICSGIDSIIGDVGFTKDPTKLNQFIFITDYNYGVVDDSLTGLNSNTNHSPALIKRIIQHTGVEFVCHGGNAIVNPKSKSDTIDHLRSFRDQFQDVWDKMYCCIGANDYGVVNDIDTADTDLLSYAQVHNLLNGNKRGICGLDKYGDYYLDNIQTKTRYIFISFNRDRAATIQEAEMDSSISKSPVVSDEQIKWFLTLLTNTDNDYDCILFMHNMESYYSSDGISETIKKLTDGMIAFNNRNSYEFSDITYDFSARPEDAGRFICCFCGYWCGDRLIALEDAEKKDTGIKIIRTCSDSLPLRVINSSYVNYKSESYNTEIEQAFDVISIDKENHKIYCNRVGYGPDRTLSYLPAVTDTSSGDLEVDTAVPAT